MSDMPLRLSSDFEQSVPLTRRIVALLTPTPPVVEGIDLNRYQDGELIDAGAVLASGRRFAILEACWGLAPRPTFSQFWPPLLDAGIFLMAYQFFRGDQDGAAQAEYLLETSRPMFEAQGCWAPLFADVEPFTNDPSTPATRIPNWHAWNGVIRAATRPGVYSNIPSWHNLMLDEPLEEDVIGWAAHHTRYWQSYLSPTNWPRSQILFLQYGIARVHDWCPAVPGITGDVSCDKFFGLEEQLYRLCDDTIPPSPPPPDPGEDMPTLLENIEHAQSLLDQINGLQEQTDNLLDQLHGLMETIHQQAQEEPPEPPPPPPPSGDITIQITADPRANARYSRHSNAAGRPVMEIYPSDSAPTSERIQFTTGTWLQALPGKIQADGGMRYWQLTQRFGMAGEMLYIREVDGALA